MNLTAVVITGIICITLIVIYIIGEVGKTRRARIEIDHSAGNRFLSMLTGGSRQIKESEADNE